MTKVDQVSTPFNGQRQSWVAKIWKTAPESSYSAFFAPQHRFKMLWIVAPTILRGESAE